jgi:hypothetical protein
MLSNIGVRIDIKVYKGAWNTKTSGQSFFSCCWCFIPIPPVTAEKNCKSKSPPLKIRLRDSVKAWCIDYDKILRMKGKGGAMVTYSSMFDSIMLLLSCLCTGVHAVVKILFFLLIVSCTCTCGGLDHTQKSALFRISKMSHTTIDWIGTTNKLWCTPDYSRYLGATWATCSAWLHSLWPTHLCSCSIQKMAT